MGDVAVLTAVYGGYDQLREQATQDIDTDWLCVTDDEHLEAVGPWRLIVAPSAQRPCLAAKRPRMLPWRFTAARYVIWVDANTQITSPGFAREALAHTRDGLAVFDHPRRDCVYEEAEASLGLEGQDGKYAAEPICEQAEHYRKEGHPEHWGLAATGTIAWDTHNPVARKIGPAWLAECERWSIQDQVSFPVVCRRLAARPGRFSHPQLERAGRGFGNRWQQIHPHGS